MDMIAFVRPSESPSQRVTTKDRTDCLRSAAKGPTIDIDEDEDTQEGSKWCTHARPLVFSSSSSLARVSSRLGMRAREERLVAQGLRFYPASPPLPFPR